MTSPDPVIPYDPYDPLGWAKRVNPNNLPRRNTLEEFGHELLHGARVAGEAVKQGQYNPNIIPTQLYTNPIMAALNDFRDKTVQSGLLGIIPGGQAISDAAIRDHAIRPNIVQSTRQAQPDRRATDTLEAARRGVAATNAAFDVARALGLASEEAHRGRDMPYQGVFSGIINGVNAAADAVRQIGSGYPAAPSVGLDGIGSSNGSGSYQVNMPNLTPPTAPDATAFKLNDFSDAANKLVAEAYGPQYQAIDQAKTSARTQGSRTDQLLEGLYNQLVAADKQSGTDAATRYAAEIANSKANSDSRADQAAAGYNSTAAQQAKMLKDLGLEDAAAELLNQGVSDSGWAQAQARGGADAQTDYLTAGNQTQQNYYSGLANADLTSGQAARQQNQFATNDLLDQYEQQRLGIKSQQSQDALNYGQQMQQNDFSLQQANYGVGQDAYQNALGLYNTQMSNAMQQAQLDLQAQDMSSDQALQYAQLAQQQAEAGYNRDVAARQDTYQRERDQVSDQQWQAQQRLAEAKYKTDSQLSAAELQAKYGSPQQDTVDPSPDQTAIAQISQVDPKNAGTAFSMIQQMVQDPNNAQYYTNLPALIQAAQSQAAQYGIPPGTATTAAVAYWNMIKGSSGWKAGG